MSVTFDNILNFRDVGKTVNDYLGRKLVREGVLYRSARPDDASPEDRKRLRDEFGIKTVVDLRTKTEHLKQAEKRQASQTNLPEPNAPSESVQIPGLRYQQIKVTGRRFEKFLVSQLSWCNYFKLIFLFLLGYRTQAISLISQEVLLPRGLVGLGLVTIDESGAEIADTLRTFLAPSSTPLLVHCTQGKDRTGLVVALILMVLSVPAPAIDHDYMLSSAGLSSERESRLAEIREIGLTAEWGDASPDFVAKVVEHIDVKYGGVDGYLDGVGFDASERRRLVEVLGA
ncbi:tyrosine/serine protein phosphatase [Annulohypoxylon truncatum]|uniref:tyrosine/serine protein phosphatase n=1 Tax=Annulohypoxylon truncatum TaxID=327061 RepID=UPI0020073D81|nr:tyrosine/serine protein phosphatase [Annulohypoxylon truncatum]KAI1214922.1 tyrosine/serine protein phosphatase [Annulohypoxylon truncatum]